MIPYCIKKIESCENADLKSARVINKEMIALSGFEKFTDICLDELAEAVITSKIENNQTLFTVKLEFKTQTNLGHDARHNCYRITTVDGLTFMIGIFGHPYPVRTFTQEFPSSPSERSGFTYIITYTNVFPLLSIIN